MATATPTAMTAPAWRAAGEGVGSGGGAVVGGAVVGGGVVVVTGQQTHCMHVSATSSWK
jgi:hypothetical protein